MTKNYFDIIIYNMNAKKFSRPVRFDRDHNHGFKRNNFFYRRAQPDYNEQKYYWNANFPYFPYINYGINTLDQCSILLNAPYNDQYAYNYCKRQFDDYKKYNGNGLYNQDNIQYIMEPIYEDDESLSLSLEHMHNTNNRSPHNGNFRRNGNKPMNWNPGNWNHNWNRHWNSNNGRWNNGYFHRNWNTSTSPYPYLPYLYYNVFSYNDCYKLNDPYERAFCLNQWNTFNQLNKTNYYNSDGTRYIIDPSYIPGIELMANNGGCDCSSSNMSYSILVIISVIIIILLLVGGFIGYLYM